MADFKINEKGLLIVDSNRVFLPSRNINIFPCSRRGQYSDLGSAEFYDPEARLNTERTNRIGTAINGFTDSFIVSEEFTDKSTLVFVLAGYRIEAKNFVPSDIAAALGIADGNIYAHLSLHEGVSLNALVINGIEGYFTEILYRQSTADTQKKQKNYLDVTYSGEDLSDDFFVGISFTKEPAEDTTTDAVLKAHNLPLFKISSSSWELVQTSLLPHIEHGETENSIKISGDFIVEHTKADGTVQTSFKVTDEATVLGPTSISELTVADTAIIDGATTVNDTITAEKIVTTKLDKTTGEDKGEVKTPKLRVDKITSDKSTITVDDKGLIISRDLSVLMKKSESPKDSPAVATIDKAVIGDLTVQQDDSKLTKSTGKITAKEVAAEKLTQNGNPVPTISLTAANNQYQLSITLGATDSSNPVPTPPTSSEFVILDGGAVS